jgi:heme/copper-type cytochrome/quinol oxidase subunit 3
MSDTRPGATGATTAGGAKRLVLDVERLPHYAFGHQGLVWWGTVGFMVIEGSLFIMILITYFFLRTRVTEWPPSAPNPDMTLATVNTLVLFASLIPNYLTKHAAEKFDVAKVRIFLPICVAFGVVFLTIRAFEFGALGVSWDTNAYGSIVWMILGFHTTHLLTDVADSAVLSVLMFTGHLEPKRLVDVSENALYWYFIVLSWIPVYVIVYFAPRWL